MAVEVDVPPTEPSITTELICAQEGCFLPRVAHTGRGRPSRYCAAHKPVRKERGRGETASRASSSEPSAKSIESVHTLIVMGIAGACLFVEPRYHPTQLDADNIFQPLERIYLRHAGIPTVNPDIPDAMAAVLGISAYLTRVYGDRFKFGPSIFGGGPRTTHTQATNAGPVPRPNGQPSGGSGNNDLHGAVPSDPSAVHASEVMADIYGATTVPGARIAGEDQGDDY
jgi:hypothetical protein